MIFLAIKYVDFVGDRGNNLGCGPCQLASSLLVLDGSSNNTCTVSYLKPPLPNVPIVPVPFLVFLCLGHSCVNQLGHIC